MSQYKYAEVGDTVYFWFAANDTTGTAGDGATPLYDVRLAGAAAGAAPTASGTPTLLTHADYAAGVHEIAIDTTGYAAGEYAVFCTLTISTVNPSGFCGSVKVRAVGTGALKTNVVEWEGHAVHAHTVEGLPVVQIHSAGTDGGISAPANFEDLSVTDTTGKVSPADGSIANASFNSDVGSTAYATNIIALAVRKVLDELKLDHLLAVAESDDPVDNSIIAKLAATGGDWSTFVGSTDSLQAVRDRGDSAWITATGFSTFDAASDKVYLANGAHGGAAATFQGKSITLDNGDAGGVALSITGSGTGNSHAVLLNSTNGKAIAAGSTNSDAISIDSGAAKGIAITGATDGVTITGTAGNGFEVVGATGDIVADITGTIDAVTDITNTVDADIKKVNGTSVTGNGSTTPWGPA